MLWLRFGGVGHRWCRIHLLHFKPLLLRLAIVRGRGLGGGTRAGLGNTGDRRGRMAWRGRSIGEKNYEVNISAYGVLLYASYMLSSASAPAQTPCLARPRDGRLPPVAPPLAGGQGRARVGVIEAPAIHHLPLSMVCGGVSRVTQRMGSSGLGELHDPTQKKPPKKNISGSSP